MLLPAYIVQVLAVLTKTPTLTYPLTRPHSCHHVLKYFTHVRSSSFQHNRCIPDCSFARIGGRANLCFPASCDLSSQEMQSQCPLNCLPPLWRLCACQPALLPEVHLRDLIRYNASFQLSVAVLMSAIRSTRNCTTASQVCRIVM